MIGDDDGDAAIVMQRAAQTGEGNVHAQQRIRGDLAQRHDQLGLYQVNLAFEIRKTLRDLICCRRAIFRRAAFDNVGDINILAAFQFDRHQHAVQQLARLPHEWFTLRILIRPGPFADEEPVGLLVAHAKHRLRASGAQLAGGAVVHLLFELGPVEFIRLRCRYPDW